MMVVLEHHYNPPGKAQPVGVRSKGDCTPVSVTPKDTTIYLDRLRVAPRHVLLAQCDSVVVIAHSRDHPRCT